jgi:hypothetical protein
MSALSMSSTPVQAAESGSGAYLLGLRGPASGVTPPEGVFFSNQFYAYKGSISGSLPLEGGKIGVRVQAKPLVTVPSLLWVTPLELLGGRLGLSLSIPYGQQNISAQGGPIRLSDKLSAFADPAISSYLGWKSGNFHWQLGASAYLPIGGYEAGRLANISKKRLALDTFGSLSWIDPATGIDISNAVGFTFSARNDATQYRTGNEFHWDWTISKRLTEQFTVGAIGYYYQQLSDDTGPGAKLGAFKGRIAAAGAIVGYDFKVNEVPIALKLRYFREFDAVNRLSGNAAYLSLSMPLWVKGR